MSFRKAILYLGAFTDVTTKEQGQLLTILVLDAIELSQLGGHHCKLPYFSATFSHSNFSPFLFSNPTLGIFFLLHSLTDATSHSADIAHPPSLSLILFTFPLNSTEPPPILSTVDIFSRRGSERNGSVESDFKKVATFEKKGRDSFPNKREREREFEP